MFIFRTFSVILGTIHFLDLYVGPMHRASSLQQGIRHALAAIIRVSKRGAGISIGAVEGVIAKTPVPTAGNSQYAFEWV